MPSIHFNFEYDIRQKADKSSSPIAIRLRWSFRLHFVSGGQVGGQATIYYIRDMAILPGYEYDIFISYRHNR